MSFQVVEGDGGAWILWQCSACRAEVWRGTEPPTEDMHARSCCYFKWNPPHREVHSK